MSKILVAGGSGLVGRRLTELLIEKGHQVAWLSRTSGETNGVKRYKWDVKQEYIDNAALDNAEVVINLAGAGVAEHRWTPAYKKEMYDSRIMSTRLLVRQLLSRPHQVKAFVNASAIGIYGLNTPLNMAEEAIPGGNFLAKLCVDWEAETFPLLQTTVRTTIIRVGVVLAREGGFIKEVSAPVKRFAGAALGTGKQATSWIHIDDLCNMFIAAAENEAMSGIYNGVAPKPASNKALTGLLAKQLRRPLLLPNVPWFMLRLIVGEMADMLVAGQHISADKVLATGFQFRFENAEKAIQDLVP